MLLSYDPMQGSADPAIHRISAVFIESKDYESLESQNLDHKSQQLF